MPEATAIKPAAIKPEQPKPSNENWISYTEDGLVNFQKSVENKLASAGIQHDTVPSEQNELPIHVPIDGSTQTTEAKEGALDVPGTFQPDPVHLGHLFGFTGEEAPPRTEDVQRVRNEIEKRNRAAMVAKNNPTPRKGIVSNFVDWLHDKKKAA